MITDVASCNKLSSAKIGSHLPDHQEGYLDYGAITGEIPSNCEVFFEKAPGCFGIPVLFR